jgi:hypothetical protein
MNQHFTARALVRKRYTPTKLTHFRMQWSEVAKEDITSSEGNIHPFHDMKLAGTPKLKIFC